MIRLNACCQTGEALAREHIRRQGMVGPDVQAWRSFRDEWVRRGMKRCAGMDEETGQARWVSETWGPVEVECIGAHAAALLGYAEELHTPKAYAVPPEKRGLWDGGNKGWSVLGHAA